MNNHNMLVDEMKSVVDTWFHEKQVSVADLAKMGKKKHNAMMDDLFKCLKTSITGFAKAASSRAGFIVAVKYLPASKKFPNGRARFVHGDGSYKDEGDA